MNKTKKKIIIASIQLFNGNGVSNVRNQDIAAAADISLSNFNYHFKTKQELVHAVFDYIGDMLEEQVYGNKVLIRKGQGLDITKAYFEFEENFRFMFLDTYNIMQTYPKLKEPIQRQIEEAIQIIKNLNYMSIGMGYMKPEPADQPGLYDHFAEQLWINNHFWFAQREIRGKTGNTVLKGLEACLAISYPYLTEKGVEAYQTFIEGVREEVE